jgi:uncharacterized protein
MDKEEAIKKVIKYSNRIKQYFPVKKIILFGSYINGTPREHSDIDVAVLFDETDENFLDVETKLYKLRRDVDTRIEPKLFVGNNDPCGFLEEILRTGEIIYNAEETEVYS